ncbi:unnamed protein product [Brachionus calyciflorus]|uniref:Uncharacterized protein n=1 Tax=Brachionus calyciflorus TaxID=104777 RepID=A0A814A4D9_9BILA|nr:unnamed protein product [Brachionus calyciflorus]
MSTGDYEHYHLKLENTYFLIISTENLFKGSYELNDVFITKRRNFQDDNKENINSSSMITAVEKENISVLSNISQNSSNNINRSKRTKQGITSSDNDDEDEVKADSANNNNRPEEDKHDSPIRNTKIDELESQKPKFDSQLITDQPTTSKDANKKINKAEYITHDVCLADDDVVNYVENLPSDNMFKLIFKDNQIVQLIMDYKKVCFTCYIESRNIVYSCCSG